MKKLLSGILAAVLCLGCLAIFPVSAAESVDTVEVGDAAQLKDVIAKINSGELPNDTDITLTADIDLAGVTGWKPLKTYKGTFDGAGYTIKNLTHAVSIASNGVDNLDGGANTVEYVIRSGDFGRNCFGEVGMALLVVKGEGATLKNFTLKDSSLNVTMGFNKNWQPFYGGVVAYLDGGTISDVKLENVDIPVCDQAGINQGFLGFAGLIAGGTVGSVSIENCSIDADSTVDASANKKFNAAAYVGRHLEGLPISFKNCTTSAVVKAHPDISNNDGLMWTGEGFMKGGVAAGFVAYVPGGANVHLMGCANNGQLTGNTTAKLVNADGSQIRENSIISGNKEKNGVQFNEDGTKLRVVIEGASALLAGYEDVRMIVTFVKKDGAKGTLTTAITAAYDSVNAAGVTLTASDGYSLTGVVVTGVPSDEIAEVSVSVVLDGAEFALGTATID